MWSNNGVVKVNRGNCISRTTALAKDTADHPPFYAQGEMV